MCQWLPQRIFVIGSLPSHQKTDRQEWKSFYDHLNWQLLTAHS
uniref:Uncharacterized protein n=1 Tax=Arundo donax TaxID=35708 RepID=A0A0A8ZEY3_ARUDO